MIPVYIGKELQGFLRSGVDHRQSCYTFSMLESLDLEAMFSDAAVDAGVMPRFKEYRVPIEKMSFKVDRFLLQNYRISLWEVLRDATGIDMNQVKVDIHEDFTNMDMICVWRALFPDIDAYEHIFDFDTFIPVDT